MFFYKIMSHSITITKKKPKLRVASYKSSHKIDVLQEVFNKTKITKYIIIMMLNKKFKY